MEELNIKELFNMFWNRKLYITIIVAIFIVIGVIYSFVFVSPKYKSVTSLLLAKASNSDTQTTTSESITQTDLTINSKLISTYTELIKSKSVLSEVIGNLNLDVSEDSIRNNVTVTSKKNTDLIEIAVSNSDPENAKLIANEIAKVFTQKVAQFYSMNNVQVIDPAETEYTPYNINHAKDIVIFAFIGFVVAIGYVLIANMLDTTIKTIEDIERTVGLPTLASIPEYSVESKGGKK